MDGINRYDQFPEKIGSKEWWEEEYKTKGSGSFHGTGQGYSIDYEKGTTTYYNSAGDTKGRTVKMTDEEARIWHAGAYYQKPSAIPSTNSITSARLNKLTS